MSATLCPDPLNPLNEWAVTVVTNSNTERLQSSRITEATSQLLTSKVSLHSSFGNFHAKSTLYLLNSVWKINEIISFHFRNIFVFCKILDDTTATFMKEWMCRFNPCNGLTLLWETLIKYIPLRDDELKLVNFPFQVANGTKG